MAEEGALADAGLKGPLLGGLISAVGLFGMVFAVGRIGDFEALRIIEAALPSTRFLASTAIGAGVTILALLLTLIGLSLTLDVSFHVRLYQRARVITKLTIAAIVIGVALLLSVTVPIREVEQLSRVYDVLYYLLGIAIACLGGLMVTIGLMISSTLSSLIELAHPEGSNQLLEDETDSIHSE
jgi:uncharacterized membrane protein